MVQQLQRPCDVLRKYISTTDMEKNKKIPITWLLWTGQPKYQQQQQWPNKMTLVSLSNLYQSWLTWEPKPRLRGIRHWISESQQRNRIHRRIIAASLTVDDRRRLTSWWIGLWPVFVWLGSRVCICGSSDMLIWIFELVYDSVYYRTRSPISHYYNNHWD